MDQECWNCGGEGAVENSCLEDSCCCVDPEEEHGSSICGACQGTGVVEDFVTVASKHRIIAETESIITAMEIVKTLNEKYPSNPKKQKP